MSWPHFLHGDPTLLQGVRGLNPDESRHSFIFNIEPVSNHSSKSRKVYLWLVRVLIVNAQSQQMEKNCFCIGSIVSLPFSKFHLELFQRYGLSLTALAKLQMNLLIAREDGTDVFRNISQEKIYYPFAWLSEGIPKPSEVRTKNTTFASAADDKAWVIR